MPGALAAQPDQGLAGGLLAEGAHQVERALLEAQCEAATEVEVGRIADLAVDDVHALREEDAQQALADRLGGVGRDLDLFARWHRDPGVDRLEDRRGIVVRAFHLGLQRVGFGDDGVAVRQIEHEEGPGMDEFGGDAVDFGGRGAVEQHGGFVAPVVENAVEHEAGDVGRDQGHLAGHAEGPAQVFDHGRVALFPADHFHGRVAPGRGEEVGHRGAGRVLHLREDQFRRQGTGVRGDQGVRPYHGLDLGEDPALEGQVLRGGLDHPVGIGDVGIVHRAIEVVDHILGLGLAHLAAGDGLPRVLGEAQQGGFDRLLVDVDQVELEAGNRTLEVVADVGADGAGADDGDGAGQGTIGSGQQGIGEGLGHGGILSLYAVYNRIIQQYRSAHNWRAASGRGVDACCRRAASAGSGDRPQHGRRGFRRWNFLQQWRHRHLVAACGLGPVERFVGTAQQRVDAGIDQRRGGKADAHGVRRRH
jgi:hypothetical protein